MLLQTRCCTIAALSALLVMASAGCMTVGERLRQNVMRQVERADRDMEEADAFEVIDRLGVQTVPYLCEAIVDPRRSPHQVFWITTALSLFRDTRAIPALVRIADACPVADVTDEVIKDTLGAKMISLDAQRAISRILYPGESGRFGEYYTTFPDPFPPHTLAVQRKYYTNLNKWYREWRATYDEKRYEPPKPCPAQRDSGR